MRSLKRTTSILDDSRIRVRSVAISSNVWHTNVMRTMSQMRFAPGGESPAPDVRCCVPDSLLALRVNMPTRRVREEEECA